MLTAPERSSPQGRGCWCRCATLCGLQRRWMKRWPAPGITRRSRARWREAGTTWGARRCPPARTCSRSAPPCARAPGPGACAERPRPHPGGLSVSQVDTGRAGAHARAARSPSPSRGARDAMDYKATIKPFILGNFLFTDDSGALADDTSLIRGGIVDSTGILELIEFLESAYDIRVSPEELVPANFDSISIFLGRKTAGGVQ